MDCYEIYYIYSWCPQAEPRPDFGDPLTFPLAPPASQNIYDSQTTYPEDFGQSCSAKRQSEPVLTHNPKMESMVFTQQKSIPSLKIIKTALSIQRKEMHFFTDE